MKNIAKMLIVLSSVAFSASLIDGRAGDMGDGGITDKHYATLEELTSGQGVYTYNTRNFDPMARAIITLNNVIKPVKELYEEKGSTYKDYAYLGPQRINKMISQGLDTIQRQADELIRLYKAPQLVGW
jgi:hypothetical protein